MAELVRIATNVPADNIDGFVSCCYARLRFSMVFDITIFVLTTIPDLVQTRKSCSHS